MTYLISLFLICVLGYGLIPSLTEAEEIRQRVSIRLEGRYCLFDTNDLAEALTRVHSAIETGRFLCMKRVPITFSHQRVGAGESYGVRIPSFAGQVIDVGYELTAARYQAPVTGVVSKWCELDSGGEAQILVPAEHPTGVVRITKVRSRTNDSRWYRAGGAIQVARADEPLDH